MAPRKRRGGGKKPDEERSPAVDEEPAAAAPAVSVAYSEPLREVAQAEEEEEAADAGGDGDDEDDTAPAGSRFLEELEGNPIVVNNYSWPDIKHTLDDSIRRILVDDWHYAENHSHTDRRLLLGYSACMVSVAATAYSFLVPFEASRWAIVCGVAAYLVLNTAMVLYALLVERDCVFVGVKRDPLHMDPDQKITVSTEVDRIKAEYTFRMQFAPALRVASGGAGGGKASVVVTRSVGEWFDVEGEFAADRFLADVAAALQGGEKTE
ncbi:Signal peptidase complex subunit 2 [Cladochytrium tenue]|nr:Signal peptidase complex subunit 2 [Cladochytrium tenue]